MSPLAGARRAPLNPSSPAAAPPALAVASPGTSRAPQSPLQSLDRSSLADASSPVRSSPSSSHGLLTKDSYSALPTILRSITPPCLEERTFSFPSELAPRHIAFVCSLILFTLSSCVTAGLAWGYIVTPGAECRHVELASEPQHDVGTCYQELLNDSALMGHGNYPFEFSTGKPGHQFPKMYGQVKEKTIWSFWSDAENCPYKARCVMPPYALLCAETVQRHRGGFDYRFLHLDDVQDYVSMAELPLHWYKLQPKQQQESLFNALLARYGGVALDVGTILFRPLDDHWDAMVLANATFRGYMYRMNGQSWSQPESTATWFMMSRREGLFATAVMTQRTSMCRAYRHPTLALGDHTLTPILSMFNYSLPKCYEDTTVSDKAACPEFAQPNWASGITGSERSDRKLMLEDPRDGPELHFISRSRDMGLGQWKVSNATIFNAVEFLPPKGAINACSSMYECWQRIFLFRFRSSKMPFLRLIDDPKSLARFSRRELLSDNDTYFYHWLSLSGLNKEQLSPDAGRSE